MYLQEVISSTNLSDLDSMKDMIKERMDQAENAASILRNAAESTNTQAFDQSSLQCEVKFDIRCA